MRSNRLGILDIELAPEARAAQAGLAFEAFAPGRRHVVAKPGTWSEVPDDPSFFQQWGLSNQGQQGGVPDADIDADLAWDVTTGSSEVVVAVIDSGTLITHPDLAPNIWQNTQEIPSNGVDDDGNGFVDDVFGWDFDAGDNDPVSSNSHGTRVAGVVGARTNNGIGIAGVAGGFGDVPGCRMMILNVGNGAPNPAAIDDAILYAIDNGARVITLSLAVAPDFPIQMALSEALAQGVFVCASAGNGAGPVTFPAVDPAVVAVGATNSEDLPAPGTNGGPALWVAAPGVNIRTTTLGNAYTSTSGTSFAAPFVAGVAALILSVKPDYDAVDVRRILRDTAEDIGPPGFDSLTGFGRVNARDALDFALAADCDGNGRFDELEIVNVPALDANQDGILDACQGTAFCFGDGGVSPGCTPCPCGNDSPPGSGGGCMNSNGTFCVLTMEGFASLAQDTLRFDIFGATPSSFAVLTSGANALPNSLVNPCPAGAGIGGVLLDGLRCVGGNGRRHGSRATSSFGSNFQPWGGPGAPAVGILGQAGFTVGETRHFQVFHRELEDLGCMTGQNTSNAITITVTP